MTTLRSWIYGLAAMVWAAAPLAAAVTLKLEPVAWTVPGSRVVDAEEGALWVPEQSGVEASRTLRLSVVRLRSTASTPGTPIVYLRAPGMGHAAESPAESAAEAVRSRFGAFDRMRRLADLWVVDLRGSGASRPSLACRQTAGWPLDRVLTRRAALDQLVRQSRKCARAWARRRVDLDAYSAGAAAEDLEELRRAMGTERIVLWAVGDATRIALAALARHGEHVARAVLHGVEPPGQPLELPAQLDAVLAELERRAGTPGVAAALAALGRELDARPRTVEVAQPEVESGVESAKPVTFGGWELLHLFVRAMEHGAFLRRLPAVVRALEAGEPAAWESAARRVLEARQEQSIGSAAAYVRRCAVPLPAGQLREIEGQARASGLGFAANFPYPEVCSAWSDAAAEGALRPFESTVPVLLVSGSLDLRSPPGDAVRLAGALPNSRMLLLEGAARDELLDDDPRLLGALEEFLSGRPPSIDRIDRGAAFEPMKDRPAALPR